MIKIFDFNCYKQYIKNYITTLPNRGRGEYLKISKVIKVHSTLVSQIFNGNRDLSLEQGYTLTNYLKLDDLETKYFLILISLNRAGTKKLRDFYLQECNVLKKQANKLSYRLKIKKKISEKESAIFYSDSIYSQIRLLIGTNRFSSYKDIASQIDISENKVIEVLEFLLKTGLIVKNKNNKFTVGPSKTHIDKNSPFILNHHRNWRNKAIHKQSFNDANDLFFTSSMTLSKKDFKRIQEEIKISIDKIAKIVELSNPEELVCLNIDCFTPR